MPKATDDHTASQAAAIHEDDILGPPETVLETLMFTTSWLGLQSPTVVRGLRDPNDAVKLWTYMDQNPGTSRYVDEWPTSTTVALLGYSPV